MPQYFSINILREEEYVGKRAMVMEVPWKRRREGPKLRWLDNIKNDLSEREQSEEEAQGRVKRRRLIRGHSSVTWEGVKFSGKSVTKV